MKTTDQHKKISGVAGLLCISLSVLFFFTSCKKEIAISPPITQVVTSNVFNNDATATSAQLSVYAQMYQWNWRLDRNMALSSDEFFNYATDQTSKDLYVNSLNAITDAGLLQVWSQAYNYIYQENAVLENLSGTNGVSAKVKRQLTGEALFMRAYWYFYLVNLYGDVPLATTTNYKTNEALARTPKSTVYQQMITDLLSAQGSLSNNFVDVSDTTATTDRVRPTSWAAAALLARAYLYTGQYTQAEASATTVINNTAQFSLLTDLTQVFKKNSKEAIWQILPQSSVNYTYEGLWFILVAAPGTTSGNSTTVSPSLLTAFETGDTRRTAWISSYTSGANTYYFPYKYRDNNTATTLSEYNMMLRLAELYLIRAEARVQQGNTAGALADLNAIRNRANLPNYAGATDKTSLMNAILHERQVELFTEGQRWFDLKRSGNVDALMGPICAAKGGSWNTTQQLYPIVVTDIQNDANLGQNPGY